MFILSNIWPADVSGWITLISLIVGLIGAIVALIPTIIKLVKALKEILANKNWKKILELADIAMKAAEETGKPGAEKQQIVIDAVKQGCQECGIELDDNLINDLVKYINETIKWFNDMSVAENENKGE